MSTTPRFTFIGLYNFDPNLFDNLTLPTWYNKATAVNYFLTKYGECPVLYTNPTYIKSAFAVWSVTHQEALTRMITALTAEYNPIHNFDRYEDYTDEEEHSKEVAGTGTNTLTHTGTDTTLHTGTDTTLHTGTDRTQEETSLTTTGSVDEDTTTTDTISAFNASTYQPDKQQTVVHDVGTEEEQTGERDSTETLNLSDATTKNLSDATTLNLTDLTTRNLLDNESGDRTLEHTGHLYGNIGVTKSQEMVRDEIALREELNLYDILADMLHKDFCLYYF